MCMDARPSVRLSLSLRRGLEEMEVTMDRKRIDRLNNRVRNSDMLSIHF